MSLLIDERCHDLGGFHVGRVLPHARQRMVGPFVFFDHMGPAELPAGLPREADVRPHPHIGLATLTYLFDGEITHRDSVGSQQPIRPGEVNWMVAGRGITHSERFERARSEGLRMHGIQAWVALPQEDEECDPGFAHHGEAVLPQWSESGLHGRLIAGTAFGLRAPVAVRSPLFYVHWTLQAQARTVLPAGHAQRAVFVAAGTVEVDGQVADAGRLVVLAPQDTGELRAVTPATVVAIGGEPVGPRFIDWNFVSSSRERILQARADWQAGRMKLPDGDDREFIPLPARPAAAPHPLS